MRKGKNLSKSVATHLDLAVYLGFLTVLYLAPLKGISSPISPAPTMVWSKVIRIGPSLLVERD